MKLAFDIEADGLQLDATKIHCIVFRDVVTHKEWLLSSQKDYETFYEETFDKAEEFIGHNIIDYDIPVLERILNWNFSDKKLFDTLVASKLIYADIKDADVWRVKNKTMPPQLLGSYSLKSFGYRLGEHKQDFTTDWSEFTPEMLEYCRQDVKVTSLLYNKLIEEEYQVKLCL